MWTSPPCKRRLLLLLSLLSIVGTAFALVTPTIVSRPICERHWALKPSTICIYATSSSSTDSTDSTEQQQHQPYDNDTAALTDLPLPPSLKSGPFRPIRDFIGYVRNPVEFMHQRRKALDNANVFMCYMFFKLTLVISRPEAIQAFISPSSTRSTSSSNTSLATPELRHKVVNSALPDTFTQLHTEYGALNLDSTQTMHRQSRDLFRSVLGREALSFYAPVLEQLMDDLVNEQIYNCVVKGNNGNSDGTTAAAIEIVPILIEFALQAASRIFAGPLGGLTPEQIQYFRGYNDGLLSISTRTGQFKRGKKALEELQIVMNERLEAYRQHQQQQKSPGKVENNSDPNDISTLYLDKVTTLPGFVDNYDRQKATSVLMIWGSYAEAAALMVNSLSLLMPNVKVSSSSSSSNTTASPSMIQHEYKAALEKYGSDNTFDIYNSLPYTLGVVRESLRLIPQVGGGFRSSDEDFELMGYRVPAGTVVTMEPRIGNFEADLYPDPYNVVPERWMKNNNSNNGGSSSSSSRNESKCPLRGSALGKGLGAWQPASAGAHACPGMGLAEMLAKMFLVKMTERFETIAASNNKGFDSRTGKIKYIEIPVKIPVDKFSVELTPRL